jgi:hypothetical protein
MRAGSTEEQEANMDETTQTAEVKPERPGKIGGGFIVLARRGKKAILMGSPHPWEHGDFDSAYNEAIRLSEAHPGRKFVVLQQVIDTVSDRPLADAEVEKVAEPA